MADEVYWDDKYRSKANASAMPASNGVMDCGATTLAAGSETIKDFVRDCRQKAYLIEDLRSYKCRRPSRFENGRIKCAQRCGTVPASFKQKPGALYICMAPGRTPILFPTPLLEAFGVQVDYAMQTVARNGGDFEAATPSP
eukprot:7413683-Pyramimonas_sp.AAC.1